MGGYHLLGTEMIGFSWLAPEPGVAGEIQPPVQERNLKLWKRVHTEVLNGFGYAANHLQRGLGGFEFQRPVAGF